MPNATCTLHKAVSRVCMVGYTRLLTPCIIGNLHSQHGT